LNSISNIDNDPTPLKTVSLCKSGSRGTSNNCV